MLLIANAASSPCVKHKHLQKFRCLVKIRAEIDKNCKIFTKVHKNLQNIYRKFTKIQMYTKYLKVQKKFINNLKFINFVKCSQIYELYSLSGNTIISFYPQYSITYCFSSLPVYIANPKALTCGI